MKNRRPSHPPQTTAGAAVFPSRVIQIEKPVYGGSFLGRDEGKAIFVPLVLPGEQARVQIVEDKGKRGYAKAELIELNAVSPERVAPSCPHFGTCGGCHYQHANYPAQLQMKQQILRETLERGGVNAPDEIAVLSADPWQYRNRIRVAFDAKGDPGYRGRRSHQVVAIHECPIAAPALIEAALTAADIFKQLPLPNRPTELSFFSSADGKALLASVFAGARGAGTVMNSLGTLIAEIPGLRGIELAEQRGEHARAIAQTGEGSLNYRAGNCNYRVDYGAFFQVNRKMIDPLIDRVVSNHDGRLAWDLFAGVGLFARQLVNRFERVVAVESAPAATPALIANLAGTNSEPLAVSALEFLRRKTGPRPELIVVDPPRTGLGEEIVSLLVAVAAPALAYVSCDPATLARDLRGLLAGGYAMESVALVDLFPQTFHLETVVHLRRA